VLILLRVVVVAVAVVGAALPPSNGRRRRANALSHQDTNPKMFQVATRPRARSAQLVGWLHGFSA